ncbi:threonine-phosphate decarboxylase CobD [Marinobacter nauticus]
MNEKTMVEPVPEHGGRLRQAARQWGVPESQWLDLSTGINPNPWPIPEIPAPVWQRLPEDDDGLPELIRQWVEAPAGAACLPVAGSQAAIQALPQLYAPCRVGIPVPGYREHGYWWQRAGHTVVPVPLESVLESDEWLASLDVLVWIHPNNPTGLALPAGQLQEWHRSLQARGGTLVVDEAFVTPGADSLATSVGVSGLVVLRSLGKFFGLAGVRAGAVMSDDSVISALSHRLGPWAMSGPARYLMKHALQDVAWQARTRDSLLEGSRRLSRLLAEAGFGESAGTELFRYLPHPDALAIYGSLARQGILVRLFEQPPALRFGLPGSETEWQRLAAALCKCH